MRLAEELKSTLAPISAAAPALTVASTEPVVRVQGLTKKFPLQRSWAEMARHPFRRDLITVVDHVSLEITRGEFFGLLGPNGAGKTTLFKMLSTLVFPDSGTATVAGHDIRRHPERVRRILTPVIADERSLNWRLSADENLLLYAALHGLRGAAAKKRVWELLHSVELADTGRKMAGKFSSGMRQRLLIARALLARPSVLLLDEPTRSLDPVSARRFRQFLREDVVGVQGCTVLLATHNAEEALELCDRVGVLNRGRLLAVGRADDLARDVLGERYRIDTRDPAHPVYEHLHRTGRLTRTGSLEMRDDGWARIDVTIPGGANRAGEVLAELVQGGAEISSFERIPFTLADLIERVVDQRASVSRDV